MPALVIMVAVAFVLGCLTTVGEQKLSRSFNTASAGGAFLYAVSFLLAFSLSFLGLALVGTLLGTYPRDHRPALVGYLAGLALITFCYRVHRSSR